MDARFYNADDIDIERLANDLEQKYRIQGYEVQQIGDKDRMMVQLKKGGDLAALIGMQSALSVIIQHMAGGTVAMIGQQKWIDKAAVGAVGLVAAPILWPLMLTAGAGAIRQASLGNQVLNEVDWMVRQQKPEVRLGPIPMQAMPQVQQQWSPPPPQYYTPVYTPPAPVYTPPPQPTPVYVPPTQNTPSSPAPASSQLRCPNCNTPYEEGDTYCSGCGRSLKTLCPNCKAEIKPGLAFCPRCGASVFQTLSGTQAAQPAQPAQSSSPAPVAPTLYPQPAPKPQPAPPQPKPQPYVPPVPQEPPSQPKPTITYVPGSSKPASSPPQPKQPPVPVYKPPTQTPPPPVQPPTPVYIPPAQSGAQPTVQTNVSPDANTLQAPRSPIKARPSSQPAASPKTPWGKLIFENQKEVELVGEQMLIGRVDHDLQGINPDVDLSDLPGADTTSRIHATIEHVGSLYTITDLNSTNATRVNSKRIEPDKAVPINDGDTLQFGKVTSTFKKL